LAVSLFQKILWLLILALLSSKFTAKLWKQKLTTKFPEFFIQNIFAENFSHASCVFLLILMLVALYFAVLKLYYARK